MISLKKNKDNIRRDYRNNYFKVISYSSQHDILKYNLIDILKVIEKEELFTKINDRVLNSVRNSDLIIIKTNLYLLLNINLIAIFFA